MDETKYTVTETGPRIEEFLDTILDDMDLDVEYEILDGAHTHPDLEDPDLIVKFSGPDVDLLLANKAEVLLALEYLTMEALRMPPEHHSRLCFDANDYRLLRIEELRLSAITAAERVKKTAQPVPLQSHEQPRAAHHSPEPAQRNRHPQREHRRGSVPPGGGGAGGHAVARADPAAAPCSGTRRRTRQTTRSRGQEIGSAAARGRRP